MFSGGPGSKKGRVVDDLVSSYGFKFLSMEELVISEMPVKLSNVMKLETLRDVSHALRVSHKVRDVSHALRVSHKVRDVSHALRVSHKVRGVSHALRVSHKVRDVSHALRVSHKA